MEKYKNFFLFGEIISQIKNFHIKDEDKNIVETIYQNLDNDFLKKIQVKEKEGNFCQIIPTPLSKEKEEIFESGNII